MPFVPVEPATGITVEHDSRKFRRAEPDERRDLLISATLKCLAEEGHAGVSVRCIAKKAGVSLGLVSHHFGSIDVLIAETYQKLFLDFTHALQEKVDRTEGATARSTRSCLARSPLGYWTPTCSACGWCSGA